MMLKNHLQRSKALIRISLTLTLGVGLCEVNYDRENRFLSATVLLNGLSIISVITLTFILTSLLKFIFQNNFLLRKKIVCEGLDFQFFM